MTDVLPFPFVARSRFCGLRLATLFGLDILQDLFDADVWTLAGHPQVASSTVRDRIHWGPVPFPLREQLKELVVLAAEPSRHADVTTALVGVRPLNLTTIHRWIPHLCVDLMWLSARAGSLSRVTQEDLDAWAVDDDLDVDYRRIGAIQSFARYCAAMTPDLDLLLVTPWPGESALSVAGGLRKGRANTTLPLDDQIIGPWYQGAMLLVGNAQAILELAASTLGEELRSNRASTGRAAPPSWLESDLSERDARGWLRDLATACLFVTAAFSGMRATELEAIPRRKPLSAIEVAGVRRWLLVGYLVKGMRKPRREQWLVPPIVADAVEAMTAILELLQIPADRPYLRIGEAPLFDQRVMAAQSRNGLRSRSATMNLARSTMILGARLGQVAEGAGLPSPTAARPSGRELRRTFAMVVAARPGGPQAAMDQFKWQHADTAAGYFRLAPDSVALSQRELYEDIRELQRELVLDVAVREYDLWAQAVTKGQSPSLPAGPDSRRKRDLFTSIHEALEREPRVVEDDRRLRSLLRPHMESVYLTEFGFCDYNEEFALCKGLGGPIAARCRPNECLNACTLVSTLAAHQVRHDRFVQLSRDRSMPKLARQKLQAECDVMARDLGELLEAVK